MLNDCDSEQRNKRATRSLGSSDLVSILLLMGFWSPFEASAYIGPGAGISAIGSLLALLAAILFAVIGFVWYPIKRLWRRKKQAQTRQAEQS